MSRLTGNDAYGLMEAYSAVYQPRLELTEEEIWEEVENFVNELIEEGYDLSEYTWEDMYEAYIEEARAEGVKPYKPQPLKPLPQAKPLSGQRGDGSGMVQGKAINNPTASSLPKGSSAKPKLSREIIRRPQAEQVDVYDLILSHLLDEGYASSVESAEKIMVNMSEEWIESILG